MNFKEKKVLVRTEYNVPLDSKGNIKNNSRIMASLPTLKRILEDKPTQLIIMFHLGRPDGREKHLKTDKVAKELEKLLKRKVKKVDHCGEKELPDDKIIVLENLRFYEGEKSNNRIFAKQLAGLAEVYVNESFGVCHRHDASVNTVAQYFAQNRRLMGFLLKKEVEKLTEVYECDDLTVIIGFAKISDKLKIMKKLIKKSKKVLVGGAVAFSFLKSQGYEVGESLAEDIEDAKEIYEQYKDKIVLPVDFVGKEKGKKITYDFDKMSKSFVGLDIGKKSVRLFEKEIEDAGLIFWNGPMGKFEEKPFDKSTKELAKFLEDERVVVGGGDTVSAVKGFNFYHISTGGGASLQFIEKGTLPALKWLDSKRFIK